MKSFILKSSKYGFLILLIHSILALLAGLFLHSPTTLGYVLIFPWMAFWFGAIGSCGFMGSSGILESCSPYTGIAIGVLVVLMTYFIFGAILYYIKKAVKKAA